MQKLLLASAAAAAFTLAAGAASAQGAADWTGFYVGATVGYADGRDKKSETIQFDTNLDGGYGDTVRTAAGADAFSPGFCGGSFNTNAAPGGCRGDDDSNTEWSVRAGYDRQFGSFVVGGVVEYSRLELQDSVTAFSTTPASYNFTRKLKDTWAIRARGGYAFDNVLLYATGGLARGKVAHSFRTTNTANAFPVISGTGAHRNGYQLGGGAEYRVLPNVTIGAEFLHTRLNDDNYVVRASNSGTTAATNPFLLVNTGGTGFLRSSHHVEYNSLRATVAYRF